MTAAKHIERAAVAAYRRGIGWNQFWDSNADAIRRAEPWPPVPFALPDSIEAIEAGRFEQKELFGDVPDDSREGRIARILGTVHSVRTANTMELSR